LVFGATGTNSLRVLVVEDDFLLRDNITTYLRDCGMTVYETDSAEAAIAMCRAGVLVDVLFTDINLRGLTQGWAVAEAFRTAIPRIGVVYTSGNSGDHQRGVAGSLFVRKPYRRAEILQACQLLPKQ